LRIIGILSPYVNMRRAARRVFNISSRRSGDRNARRAGRRPVFPTLPWRSPRDRPRGRRRAGGSGRRGR